MAVIPDKTGRSTTWGDKNKSNIDDSDINVCEWNVFPYNDLLDETLGGKATGDMGGRSRNITDLSGRTKTITDTSGRATSFTDQKQNSVVLWDDSTNTWSSATFSWDGYRL